MEVKESERKENVNRYAKGLSGITYPEWIKLKTAVDRAFEKRRTEAERELHLDSTDDVKIFIQSQFG